jgi:GntP family gluconate:H+ symporter
MDQGFMLFGIIIAGVAGMIILISKFKWHPFIAMLIASYFIGMASGLGVDKTINIIKSGFGGILGNIGIVIASGAIIGIILEKTGAALTMANFILGIVGKKRAALTMSITGYITSIPVFCDSGFVILSPINRALSEKSGVSLAVMATALSSGLYKNFIPAERHPPDLVHLSNRQAPSGCP